MTREQKLFECARSICDGFRLIEFERMLKSAGYPRNEVIIRMAELTKLKLAVFAYEVVPFSDGHDEQDISPDAPNYNPKVSGRL